MNSAHDEHSPWLDRIQDALEGELNAQELAELHAHLQACAICRNEHAKLMALDAQLTVALRVSGLDAQFSARVLARVDAAQASRREHEKARAQGEFQRRVGALTPSWRELLGRHAGSLIGAGATLVAVLASLSAWFETIKDILVAGLNTLAPFLGAFAMPALFTAGSLIIASAAMVWLRQNEH